MMRDVRNYSQGGCSAHNLIIRLRNGITLYIAYGLIVNGDKKYHMDSSIA
jgi:hypothetical protein